MPRPSGFCSTRKRHVCVHRLVHQPLGIRTPGPILAMAGWAADGRDKSGRRASTRPARWCLQTGAEVAPLSDRKRVAPDVHARMLVTSVATSLGGLFYLRLFVKARSQPKSTPSVPPLRSAFGACRASGNPLGDNL